MSYIVPIHRASSIRHALKLHFLDPEEETLVVACVSSKTCPMMSSTLAPQLTLMIRRIPR
ncbi:uncharacterized protein BJX67DRAFT_347883 [Aspergillus lucknowensis]|uniref:Uncharacterized protein n=1 Tax=Aspergillus lucknowensis TaxID=176173 RepID=A0ABR4LXG6_9EURO